MTDWELVRTNATLAAGGIAAVMMVVFWGVLLVGVPAVLALRLIRALFW